MTHLPKRNGSRWPRGRGVGSEEVAELEVQLEARRRPPEGIGAVEAVRPVDADRPEGRDDVQADAGAAEQARRVEVPSASPDVAGVRKGADVEHLRQPR